MELTEKEINSIVAKATEMAVKEAMEAKKEEKAKNKFSKEMLDTFVMLVAGYSAKSKKEFKVIKNCYKNKVEKTKNALLTAKTIGKNVVRFAYIPSKRKFVITQNDKQIQKYVPTYARSIRKQFCA